MKNFRKEKKLRKVKGVPTKLPSKKVRYGNCADKFICIESDLIGFGYDPSDIQAGLRCWTNGVYIFVVNILSS